MPGYKVIAAGGLKTGLVCPECSLVLKEAVQTPEGFRLCESCYKAIESEVDHTSKKSGISVVGEDGKPSCFPDKAVRRDVAQLEVQCNNWNHGCKWIGQLKEYFQMHETECCFKLQPCPDCNDLVREDELLKHCATECQKRSVPCMHCRQTVVYDGLQKHHNNNCEKFPLQCGLCGQQVPRDEMGDHKLKECKALQCMYKDLGKLFPLNTHQDGPESIATCLKSPATLLMHLLRIFKMFDSRLSTVENMLNNGPHLSSFHNLPHYLEDMEKRLHDMTEQMTPLQESSKGENISQMLQELRTRVDVLEERKDEGMEQHKVHVSEMELQLQASLASTYNGSFLWRIPDLSKRRQDAIAGRVTSLYSPPFYTAKNGYKMCTRVYLNGDGMGHKTHLSLFFVLMKGEFDALLKWPFEKEVTLILVDQSYRKHLVQTFKPTPESSSFHRPISDMNVASGCPQFCKLSILDDDNYSKDDTLFIKCIVDTSRFCSEHEPQWL